MNDNMVFGHAIELLRKNAEGKGGAKMFRFILFTKGDSILVSDR